MIPVLIFINGVQKASYRSWPQVPRVGEIIVCTLGNYKVTRVAWITTDAVLSVHLYLKPAHTQL